MRLKRTGQKMAFLDVGIGQPYFAHGRFWIRTSFEAGTELKDSTNRGASTCNFLIDGTVRPKYGPYSGPNEICEEVEEVAAENV